MILFVANGHEAQLTARQWHHVVDALRRRRRTTSGLPETILAEVEGIDGKRHVRVWLHERDLALVREIVEAM